MTTRPAIPCVLTRCRTSMGAEPSAVPMCARLPVHVLRSYHSSAAHKACGSTRPCVHCIQRGLAHLCFSRLVRPPPASCSRRTHPAAYSAALRDPGWAAAPATSSPTSTSPPCPFPPLPVLLPRLRPPPPTPRRCPCRSCSTPGRGSSRSTRPLRRRCRWCARSFAVSPPDRRRPRSHRSLPCASAAS